MDKRLLQSSGLNNAFHGHGLSFADYIAQTREMIKNARIDISAENETTVLNANSPYELRPSNEPKRGVLLIHGLYDSPYSLQDIGQQFYQQGFLVRGILLPGHGTRPGDMLTIKYQEWIKAVDYAIADMQKQVDEIIVIGFSLGGALTINQSQNIPAVKANILIAPAFKTIIPYAQFVSYHPAFSWINNKLKWYQIEAQKSYAKYESFCFNAAHQARVIMRKVYKNLTTHAAEKPIFIVATQTDESVSTDATMAVFQRAKNQRTQFLLYSANNKVYNDKRINLRTSFYPEHNILDFSHICLPIAPSNRHYGRHGDYHSFIQKDNPTPGSSDIAYGAVNRKKNNNAKNLIRLTYNPDFDFMTQSMIDFVDNL